MDDSTSPPVSADAAHGPLRWVDRKFGVTAAGSSIRTEILAGFASFFTAAFIIVVNPQLISDGLGIPKTDAAVSTAAIAALATGTIGVISNKPFTVVPGMGINAYLALTVSEDGEAVEQAFAASFIAGLILALCAATGVLGRLAQLVPLSLRMATVPGIGLFIALVGLQNAGVVVNGEIGDLEDPAVWLFIGGFMFLLLLDTMGSRNSMLLTIILVTIISWSSGLSDAPSRVMDVPTDFETFWKISFKDWRGATYEGLVTIAYTDLLVQPTCLLAVLSVPGLHKGQAGEQLSELPSYGWKIWTFIGLTDSVAAMFGTTPVALVMESAAGIRTGGRTGLTAMVTATLFALSILFAPILAACPPEATACPLLIVGALMMGGVRQIDWHDMEIAAPAFVTLVMIPFTFNVGTGLIAGLMASIFCHIGAKLRPKYQSLWGKCSGARPEPLHLTKHADQQDGHANKSVVLNSLNFQSHSNV